MCFKIVPRSLKLFRFFSTQFEHIDRYGKKLSSTLYAWWKKQLCDKNHVLPPLTSQHISSRLDKWHQLGADFLSCLHQQRLRRCVSPNRTINHSTGHRLAVLYGFLTGSIALHAQCPEDLLRKHRVRNRLHPIFIYFVLAFLLTARKLTNYH